MSLLVENTSCTFPKDSTGFRFVSISNDSHGCSRYIIVVAADHTLEYLRYARIFEVSDGGPFVRYRKVSALNFQLASILVKGR